MALVILPLLPEGPYGPFGGIRPRELWAMALFFSGLSFAGYAARRMLGSYGSRVNYHVEIRNVRCDIGNNTAVSE